MSTSPPTPPGAPPSAAIETLDRQLDEGGATLELRRRGEALEVLHDGRRVLTSATRRSEQALVELAMAPLIGRDDISVLLGGLGMGYTLRALLAAPGVKRVDVVEGSRAMIEWEARYFAALNGDVRKDARVHVHEAELGAYLKAVRLGSEPRPEGGGWLALLLDLDHGPGQLWRAGNAALYGDDGLEHLEEALRPGGVLALWSSGREPELRSRLHSRLQNLAEVVVPVEVDGAAAFDYVYRARRGATEPRKPLN